jgi:hypothetical protein
LFDVGKIFAADGIRPPKFKELPRRQRPRANIAGIRVGLFDNTMECYFEKGTPLPARCRKVFHTTRDVRRGSEDELIKVPVLRYGGMKLYARARPFFIGLMLGEFAMAVFWTLISATTGAPTPEFPWP